MSDLIKLNDKMYFCMMCGKLTENTFYCNPCMEKGEEAEEEELKKEESETCPTCHGNGRFSRRGCNDCGDYAEDY